MFQIQVNPLADNPLVLGNGGTHQIRAQFQNRVIIIFCCQSFFRHFNTKALNSGKADFKMIPIRTICLDVYGFPGRLRRYNYGFDCKIKRYPQDICIFNIKQTIIIKFIRLTAQGTANNLLTKKLGSKGPDSENMGDSIGIPAFIQHGNRDNASDGFTKLPLFANCVHRLPEQILVSYIFSPDLIACALVNLIPETLNSLSSHFSEIFIQCITGLQLLTVYKQGARQSKGIIKLVKIAEQFKTTIDNIACSVFIFSDKT